MSTKKRATTKAAQDNVVEPKETPSATAPAPKCLEECLDAKMVNFKAFLNKNVPVKHPLRAFLDQMMKFTKPQFITFVEFELSRYESNLDIFLNTQCKAYNVKLDDFTKETLDTLKRYLTYFIKAVK